MEISIIIPTYNRLKDLSECLNSIINQTILPKEILIIDNSDRDANKIKKLIEQLQPFFDDKEICLRYMQNKKENSLTVAKNLGVKYFSGEIISFLDDDIILDKQYYEEIIKIYEDYPDALGVEGAVVSKTNIKEIKFIFSQISGKLFYLGFREKNKCRVLPSMGVTYSLGNKVINCEWLSGASTFKRTILGEIKFDENLKKYSDNEDIDFSYRIFKKYPNALFLTPYAKYWHKCSKEGRPSQKESTYMREIYCLYLFYKNIDQNFKNRLIYLWSIIGKMISKTFSLVVFESNPIEIMYLIQAYILCMKHVRKIKKGNLEFFNNRLK